MADAGPFTRVMPNDEWKMMNGKWFGRSRSRFCMECAGRAKRRRRFGWTACRDESKAVSRCARRRTTCRHCLTNLSSLKLISKVAGLGLPLVYSAPRNANFIFLPSE